MTSENYYLGHELLRERRRIAARCHHTTRAQKAKCNRGIASPIAQLINAAIAFISG
jgi:hypothetical protein